MSARRGLIALLPCLAVVVALAGASGGASDSSGRYTVEFDNAFGLVPGGDLKVGGVRAGVVEEVRLDRETNRALADIELTEAGFDTLREDATCEIRMQSLLGEYYVECNPGRRGAELAPGSTVPVERTSSTVPPDLVTATMRRPYRERLRLVLGELGAAAAGNGAALNEALRRAVPALRESDRVLATLARQDRMLGQLVVDADTVVRRIAGNRRDLGRWVGESNRLAETTATRGDELAATLRTLPGLLRETAPTMRSLRAVAARGRAPVERLGRNADELATLLARLDPYAAATRDALKGLGGAADAGQLAVASAKPAVDELTNFSTGLPELSRNARIVLEHVNDRDHAIEVDPRSPGGKGFTGLEAVLEYVLNQVLAINVYDADVHLLKGATPVNRCSPYTTAEQLKADPQHAKDCAITMGPNSPGVNAPDPTAPAAGARAGSRAALDRDGTPRAVPPRVLESFQLVPPRELEPRRDSRQDQRPPLPEVPDRESIESVLDFLLLP